MAVAPLVREKYSWRTVVSAIFHPEPGTIRWRVRLRA